MMLCLFKTAFYIFLSMRSIIYFHGSQAVMIYCKLYTALTNIRPCHKRKYCKPLKTTRILWTPVIVFKKKRINAIWTWYNIKTIKRIFHIDAHPVKYLAWNMKIFSREITWMYMLLLSKITHPIFNVPIVERMPRSLGLPSRV